MPNISGTETINKPPIANSTTVTPQPAWRQSTQIMTTANSSTATTQSTVNQAVNNPKTETPAKMRTAFARRKKPQEKTAQTLPNTPLSIKPALNEIKPNQPQPVKTTASQPLNRATALNSASQTTPPVSRWKATIDVQKQETLKATQEWTGDVYDELDHLIKSPTSPASQTAKPLNPTPPKPTPLTANKTITAPVKITEVHTSKPISIEKQTLPEVADKPLSLQPENSQTKPEVVAKTPALQPNNSTKQTTKPEAEPLTTQKSVPIQPSSVSTKNETFNTSTQPVHQKPQTHTELNFNQSNGPTDQTNTIKHPKSNQVWVRIAVVAMVLLGMGHLFGLSERLFGTNETKTAPLDNQQQAHSTESAIQKETQQLLADDLNTNNTITPDTLPNTDKTDWLATQVLKNEQKKPQVETSSLEQVITQPAIREPLKSEQSINTIASATPSTPKMANADKDRPNRDWLVSQIFKNDTDTPNAIQKVARPLLLIEEPIKKQPIVKKIAVQTKPVKKNIKLINKKIIQNPSIVHQPTPSVKQSNAYAWTLQPTIHKKPPLVKTKPSIKQPIADKISFVVSYGCFSNLSEINKRSKKIQEQGWPLLTSHYTVNQITMTCLFGGPFNSPQSADQATNLFEEKGCMQLPKTPLQAP